MKHYVELYVRGDAHHGGYTSGMTNCQTETTRSLKLVSDSEDTTVWSSNHGLTITQRRKTAGEATEVKTEVRNDGSKTVVLDMLASFALHSIEADTLCRLGSYWSAEGRLKRDNLIELNLEKSWSAHGIRALKFGSVGSMPVKSYFPMAALEDSKTGRCVGAILYAPSSWQMEVICFEDSYRLVGGMADRDFGAWSKELKPGESYVSPRALVAEADNLYDLYDKLIKAQKPNIAPADREMPVVFNEWCTTWGNPTYDNIKKIAEKIAPLGIGYFVIDAGWYKDKADWSSSTGDWIPNRNMFPCGIKEAADCIRENGMIPGLWFELETVGQNSKAWNTFSDKFLKRDGYPILAGVRKFWDMEDPSVVEYLTERVINLLRENGFGYVKIDYNETIGPGCDGYESAGEGLRRKVAASQEFFKKIAREIPGIVIENCASGGHRLEPSFMEICSQGSFSDAHECTSIPIIAANLHRVMRLEQSQVWCVLQASDTPERTVYSLTNTFLGRMCISGNVPGLSDAQMDLVREAIAFYRKAAYIIRDGKTTRIETTAHSYLHPEGYQIVERVLGKEKLTVMHRFADSPELPVPEGNVIASFGELSGDFTAKAYITTEE